eukprot:g8185.t1
MWHCLQSHSKDTDYVALSHANLNVDNAYYWRDEAGKLLCGVLDWGGFGASCLGHKLWWYFNCSEFEMLKERTDAEVTEPMASKHWHHLTPRSRFGQDDFEHFMTTFVDAYRDSGGPRINAKTLERMVRLTCLQNLSVMVAAVPDCLRQIPEQDWASVKDWAATRTATSLRRARGDAAADMFGVTEDLAAEPQLPPDLPRGAVSLLILAQNINLPLLAARSDLASAFRWALQEDVAAQLCGAGVAFAPGQVEVRLLADSAAIPVTVTPSHGLPCHELHRLLSTKQLRWCAGSKLDHLEGFSQVCLSPSWCFFSVGLPSIVAASDELASTTAGSPLEAEGRVARASLNQD